MNKIRVIALLIFNMFPAFAGPNENAKIILDLNPNTVDYETSVEIQGVNKILPALIVDAQILSSYEMNIHYDTSCMEISNMALDEGLMGRKNALTVNDGNILSIPPNQDSVATGKLEFNVVLQNGSITTAFTGDGLLAVLVLKAKKYGTCKISVKSGVLLTPAESGRSRDEVIFNQDYLLEFKSPTKVYSNSGIQTYQKNVHKKASLFVIPNNTEHALTIKGSSISLR